VYHPVRPLPQVVVDVAEDDVGTDGFVLFVAPPYLVGLFLPPVFGQEYPGFPGKKPRGFCGKNPGYSWVKTPGVSGRKPRVRFIYSHRSLFNFMLFLLSDGSDMAMPGCRCLGVA